MSAPFDDTQPQDDNNDEQPYRRTTIDAENAMFDVSDEVSEADEVRDEFEGNDADGDSEEPEGEDLFNENMMDDYRPSGNPEDDRYDHTMLDDRHYDDMNANDRRRADEAIRSRERRAREDAGDRTTRRADQYYNINQMIEEMTEEPEAQDERRRLERRRKRREHIHQFSRGQQPSLEDARMAQDELPYYDPKIEWKDTFAGCLRTIFADFIWRFTAKVEDHDEERDGPKTGIYVEQLVDLIREERLSLFIVWEHIQTEFPKVSEWFSFQPMRLFKIFDEVVNEIVGVLYKDLYKNRSIKVRLKAFASYVEPMTNLNVTTLNQLVAVEGVVVKRSGILPKVRQLFIECYKCRHITGPIETKEDAYTTVREKRICSYCGDAGPWKLCRERTLYETLQFLTIQELPSAVAKGRAPVQKEVIVESDMVDVARPGDDIMLLAYHQAKRDAHVNASKGFPILSTSLIANNVIRRSDVKMSEMSADDIEQFHRLAKNPHVREKIISSIAPSIWGHRHAKTGLAMAMFGGVRQELQGQEKHSIRGDVNVLLVGDPGMAKSQMLKYVNKLVDKSVFTTGKGASAAGLTASMKKDPISGEYSLEGGALVLADTGICLIDEFDKMSELDRVSIHEAMEAQTISISKAGIVTTLRARCAVIAAANPIYGRYDPSLTFSENVTLGDTILSRFDVVAVMRDTPTTVHDQHMAEYILGTHRTSHPDVVRERRLGLAEDHGGRDTGGEDAGDFIVGDATIPQEFLAKYIMYAKKHIHPQVTANEQQKIAEFYAQVRQAAVRSGGLPLTVRHLESILRMSIANAKIRLSNQVNRQDIDFAISTMLESFIQSQKNVVAQSLGKKFGRYRALANNPFDMIETLLSDLICKKSQELLQKRMYQDNRGARDRVEAADIDTLLETSITVEELNSIAKATHDLPQTLVQTYIRGNKFKAKFGLGTDGDGQPCIFSNRHEHHDDINIDFSGTQPTQPAVPDTLNIAE